MRPVATVLGIGLFAISLLPALPLASTTPPPGVLIETTAGDSGIRMTRSLTLGAETDALPGGEDHGVALAQGGGGSILWTDTIHLNGVVQHLAISGDGAHVISGWWLNNARVTHYLTGGSSVPTWTFPITTSFFVPVDASMDASVITGTGRGDALYAWSAASNVPICTVPQPGQDGYAAMTPTVGGQFAGSSVSAMTSFIHAHPSPGCTPLFNASMSGQTQGGRYAADGAWVAVNSRPFGNIYDSQTGALRGSVNIPGETEATIGVSGDGNVVAVGGFFRTLQVFGFDGVQYTLLWGHVIPSVTWITAVDVSDDGSTVMVGTWVASTPDLGRVLMYDVASGPTPLWTNSDFGDYVDSVELNADGSRGIAGSWGRVNGTFGHIIAAFDRQSPVPVFAVEDDQVPGVGSCMVVDISDDGTRGAAGGKAIHAREFGSGGFTMALDLGGVTAVAGPCLAPLGRLALGQNRPNPMVHSTDIPFVLGEPAQVRLSIFDAAGRAVRVVDLGIQGTGEHRVPWDALDPAGRRVPGGIYFYRLEAATETASREVATRRLVVIE